MEKTDILVNRKDLASLNINLKFCAGEIYNIIISDSPDVNVVHISNPASDQPGINQILLSLARVFSHVLTYPKVGICLASHSSSAATEEENYVLSCQRALPIYYFLKGCLDDWVEYCIKFQEWMSFEELFQWLAKSYGYTCDNTGSLAKSLENGLMQFRSQAGISNNSAFGIEDWKKLYSIYSDFIATSLDITRDTLDNLRSSLEFLDPPILVCGNQQSNPPATAAGQLERIDILFFSSGDRPELKTNPPGGSIYGVRSISESDVLQPQYKSDNNSGIEQSEDVQDGFYYVVKSGDYLDKLAKDNGLSGWNELYNDPHNEDYRKSHPDPNIIQIGDRIWIPGNGASSNSALPDHENYPLLYSSKIAQQNGKSESERSHRAAVGYAQHKLNLFLQNYDEVQGGIPANSAQNDEAYPFDPDATRLHRAKVPVQLDVDNYFGDDTENAVKALQASKGINNDGKLGPITWDWLEYSAQSGNNFGPASFTIGHASTTAGFFGFPWPAALSMTAAPVPVLAQVTFPFFPLPGALIQPHEAIQQIFDANRITRWHVGCALFVQLAHLRALLKCIGSDAFNQRIILSQDLAPNNGFILRIHQSTGIRQRDYYQRNTYKDAMGRTVPIDSSVLKNGTPDPRPVKKILQAVPSGSRICWMNPNAPAGTSYVYENTIKLGPDRYAAHGFTATAGKNIFSEKELKDHLCRAATVNYLTLPPAQQVSLQNEIFIFGIEHYNIDPCTLQPFTNWIEDSVGILKAIGFGNPVGGAPDGQLTPGVDNYDQDFWEEHPQTKYPPWWLRMKTTFSESSITI